MSKQIIDVSILHGILQNGTREQKLLSVGALISLTKLNLITQNPNSAAKLLDHLDKLQYSLTHEIVSNAAFYCIRYATNRNKIYVQTTDSWQTTQATFANQPNIELVWLIKASKEQCDDLMSNFWNGYHGVYDGSFYDVNETQIRELCDGLNTWVYTENNPNITLTGCSYIIEYPKTNKLTHVQQGYYPPQTASVTQNQNFANYGQPSFNQMQLPNDFGNQNTMLNNIQAISSIQAQLHGAMQPVNTQFEGLQFEDTQSQSYDKANQKKQGQKTFFGFIKALINREEIPTLY